MGAENESGIWCDSEDEGVIGCKGDFKMQRQFPDCSHEPNEEWKELGTEEEGSGWVMDMDDLFFHFWCLYVVRRT